VDYADVDAVVISHLHADHFLDLVPFSYALTHSPRRAGGADGRRPALWAPAGARDTFRRVVGAWGDGTLVEAAFGLREYAVGDEVAAGPLRVTFAAVPHYVPTCAIAVTAGNGAGRFVFGADHGPTPALTAFGRDAALLLVEA